MSLQLLAKQMEAKGRKGDSVLVHMTQAEVAALQKMAESAGGSLTVNPETGLVEANFLKRMLPTLVGAGLMMTGVGMPLAIAGGALTGGIQAKRNDENVLMGAAMGGLGAYGGAGLAGGLSAAGATGTAAQAISNPALAGQVATGAGSQASMLAAQNAGFGAQGTASLAQAAGATTPSTIAQVGQGISALGKESGREAFMQGVGGAGGLAKAAGAVASPMMAPGKVETPEGPASDDEMIVYDYAPGRTGAENIPTASSAERRFFADNPFTNRRKVRAADYFNAKGGLLSLAEGGETTAPDASAEAMNYLMGDSGASQAGLSYLMGERDQSSGMQGAMAPQAPSVAPEVGSGQMFSFNPATGTFTRNPNYIDPSIKSVIQYDGGGGGASFHPADNQFHTNLDATPAPVFGFDFGQSNDASGFADGGITSLAKGGMASGGFVVPADVVSALGNGSTDAGLRLLKSMMGKAAPIKGKGDGLSDSIPTSIDGKQPARVADGEAYIDPKTVKRMGGAKKLYAMMDKVRAQAHGKTTQQRKVNPARVMA